MSLLVGRGRRARVRGAPADAVPVARIKPIDSGLPFALYCLYMVSFYLHFGERFPVIAPARPDFLLILLVSLATAPYVKNKVDLFRMPVAKALNWLVLWIVISLPFVEWPGSVIRENWQPFLKAILFFYFAVMLVDTPKRLKWFVFVFLACQVFRVMEPLYLNLTRGYMGGATYLGGGEFAGRLSGAPSDVINPNGLGFVIATTVVFLHFMLWQAKSFLARLTYLALVPGMLYALILSMSRGGFIALLVGGWMIFRQSRQKAALVAVAVLVGIAGWSVMTEYQKDRYLSLISDDAAQSVSREGRIEGMKREFRLGLNSPIFGHGVGTTSEAKVNVLGERRQASHNLYAELLIEVGAVGFILFLRYLWQIYLLAKGNLGKLSRQGSECGSFEYLGRLNRGLVAVFWVYAVYSLNYYGLSQEYWYVFGGTCMAFGFIMDRLSQESEIVSEPTAHKRTAAT